MREMSPSPNNEASMVSPSGAKKATATEFLIQDMSL